jgi:malonate-semialdehyde dehydrogenase (acetylating) / methylmalonate-semialdehyde dehydrogenase
MTNILPHCIGSEKIIEANSPKHPIYNPATGTIIAELGIASTAVCDQAVARAIKAFETWSETPAPKKMQILFRFRDILMARQADLAQIVTQEHGKTLEDAKGSIARGIELVEFHCGLLNQVQSHWTPNVSTHIDCSTMRVPLGVCAGASPFNFPVMVPLWMMIPAIASGNTFILKPSEQTPSAANFLLEYLIEAGLPHGVVNVVHGDKTTVDYLLRHPGITALTAVASTPVAETIYQTAIQQGKRSMTFGGAKNHAVVMPDADLDETAKALVGAGFGSAGERCMAISVVVAVTDALADALSHRLAGLTRAIRVDAGDRPNCDMGPLISAKHRARVLKLIQEGVDAGAELLVDGRDFQHTDFPDGFYLGPCLFDRVTETMSIYQEEIFGPVLLIHRVQSFEEALDFVNRNIYGNGTAIFTESGYYARTFSRLVTVGMVGVNIPIPVPIASHPFGGWKRSSFGDHGMHGVESLHFYTKSKTITSKWTSHRAVPQNEGTEQLFSMPTHRGDAS